MATITITSGEQSGQKLTIDKDEFVIGRAEGNDLRIQDPSVSGQHCCILKDGDKYKLRDLRSTNGTLLNGEPTTEAPLNSGDVFTAGSIDIEFDGPGAPASERTGSTRTVVHPGAAAPSRAGPFEARKEHRWAWGITIAAIGLLALAALAWFLHRLFVD